MSSVGVVCVYNEDILNSILNTSKQMNAKKRRKETTYLQQHLPRINSNKKNLTSPFQSPKSMKLSVNTDAISPTHFFDTPIHHHDDNGSTLATTVKVGQVLNFDIGL